MREGPRHLVVLSGDHVYKMDYARMLRLHQERKAAVTLATPPTIQRDRPRLTALRIMLPDIERLVSLRDGQRLSEAHGGAGAKRVEVTVGP